MVGEAKKLKSVNIVIDGKQVNKFKYLGSVVTQDGGCMAAIKERIGMAKVAFGKRRELLEERFERGLRKRLVECLVWPVALYGCETWTLRRAEMDELGAFGMWTWGRIEGLRCMGRPRQSMLNELMEDGSYEQLKRKAEDRELHVEEMDTRDLPLGRALMMMMMLWFTLNILYKFNYFI